MISIYDAPVVMTVEWVRATRTGPRFALTEKVVVVWFAYLYQVSSFLHPLGFTTDYSARQCPS